MSAPRRRHPLERSRSRRGPVAAVVTAVAALAVGLVLVVRGGGSSATSPLSTAPAVTTAPGATGTTGAVTGPASTASTVSTAPVTNGPPVDGRAPFRPGAEANREIWRREFPLPAPTGRRVSVGTVAEANAAMATLAPGDELVLRDGTYDGEVVVSAAGRAGAPITVRSERPGGAVVVGAGSWILSGSHLVVRDLRFDGGRGGVQGVVVVTGRHVRVTGNRFDGVGYTADDTDTRSVIRVETDVESFVLVDDNVVTRPNTVFTYLSQATGRTVFSHNVITGPNGMGGRFGSYLVKSGSVRSTTPSYTVFQYNTVTDWGRAVPEAIDEKTPMATYLANDMPDVALYLRHGSGSRVIGNRLAALFVDGADHRIEGNLIRNDAAWTNDAAPLVALTAAAPDAPVNEPAQRNRIVGNVVVYGGAPGESPFQERNLAVWGPVEQIASVRDNVVSGNVFLRMVPRAGVDDGVGYVGFVEQPEATAALLAQNSFVDNRFACQDCGDRVPVLAGTGQNRLDPTVGFATVPTPVGPVVTERPVIRSFSATAGPAGTVVLRWTVTDAWYVVLDPAGGLAAPGSGERILSTVATQATVRALGPGGWTVATAPVTVG
jgi:hypothetical protein